ncbi:MAG: hypothetical protein M3Y57_18765 [Acidobacteriota bacterium]|nr:hypothetical protein [Acidobacteriota bacterium]
MPKLADALKYAKYARPEHARKFASHIVPHVVRPAQIIWNKAIGGIFIFFSVVFFGYASKYYGTLHSDSPNAVGLGFALFLGLVMGFFGIASFLKARRLSRL